MQVLLAVMVWMASSASGFSYTASTLPKITNEDFIKECVEVHNHFRSKAYPPAGNMLYMSWDPKLAQIAKAWAQTCVFQHNPQLHSRIHPNFTGLGENIWLGSLSLFSVHAAILAWIEESQYYDFSTRKCKKVCGHYTQIVWADSYKIGCAVQLCPRGANFICNYGPAGNYPTWPYKQGATCSACPKDDKCLNNLCTNPQRDQVSRHSADYPDWPKYLRNRYTSLYLIAKSVLLLLSVIITIWVKHKYPNLVLLD